MRDDFQNPERGTTRRTNGNPQEPDWREPEAEWGHRSWFGTIGWIAAAAAILFAAYIGNRAHTLQEELTAQRYQTTQLSNQVARAQQIIDVLNSPDTQRTMLTETRNTQPAAHVIYDKNHAALIFVASNLRPVPANKTYELWLIPASGQAPIPSGLFHPDAQGSGSVVLPALPQGIDAKSFSVTIEAANGATTPTLPIVISSR